MEKLIKINDDWIYAEFYSDELLVTLFYKNDEKQAGGFLEEVDNDICKLREIDDYDYENSQSLIPINEICDVECDNGKEKKIKLLWQLNNI